MDLRTSDEFAAWFRSLGERDAVDVAATIEVITQLGAGREAPGSSEWLTWYEAPGLPERLRGLTPTSPLDPRLAHWIHEWGAFNGYARRVVKHLESRAFVERAAGLGAAHAAVVSDSLARIKKTVTRRLLAFSEYQVKQRLSLRAPTPAQERELERFVDIEEIRAAYLAALGAAGFTVADVPAHSPALREIALRSRAPGFRLLYGIDAPRNRGLVVLGEPLDRAFYGDSVRRAERAWSEFLASERRATQETR